MPPNSLIVARTWRPTLRCALFAASLPRLFSLLSVSLGGVTSEGGPFAFCNSGREIRRRTLIGKNGFPICYKHSNHLAAILAELLRNCGKTIVASFSALGALLRVRHPLKLAVPQ